MKKRLTLRFERSVSSRYNKGDLIEVVLIPLATTNNPDGNSTLVEEKQVQKVNLHNEVTEIYFDVTPTYSPGLQEPIFYRIAWRRGYAGRITETDFAMPNMDVDFDDLGELGNIITGDNFLREEDLGTPGRVARLNNAGHVVDAEGNVIGQVALEGVNALISQEIRDRQSGDAEVDRRLTLRLETQVTSLSQTMTTRFNNEAQNRTNAIASEQLARENIDGQLASNITALSTQTSQALGGVNTRLNAHDAALLTKADLVNGKLATSQIPAMSLITRVTVPDEAAMLSLTPSQVQPGDMAVRPDGNFQLFSSDPSNIDNWLPLSSVGGVSSVNGQAGVVNLSAADVGARSRDVAVPLADVNGLNAALAARATTTALTTTNNNVTALGGRVTTAENTLTALDGSVVKKVGGVVPTNLLDSDVPRVNGMNQLIKKDGTVIPTGGGGGTGTGAVDSVNGKTGVVVLNAQDVSARPAGVAIPQADVNNLAATLALKTDVSAHQNLATRVSRTETDIADLKAASGGTGGTGTTQTAVTWVADNGTAPSLVTVKSPFGIAAGGGTYYDPNGAAEGEAAVPYIDENGYLYLRKPLSNASPAPLPANQTTVNALTTRVTNLENGSAKPAEGWAYDDMAIALKNNFDMVTDATSSSTSDSLVLRNGAGTFAVGEPTGVSHPTTKGYVDTALATKATTAAVSALTTTVNSKAAQSDLTALTSRVTNAENAFSTKADLDTGSKVPINQIPTLPGSQISGWATKADLDGNSKVLLSQIPTGIPQASIQNLTTVLATKADLVNGKLSSSQIPSLALMSRNPVANRAAMLALPSSQVQPGDIAIIQGTADKGTYILNADDPSVFSNWLLLEGPTGTVTSVNGQSGTVVLSAADVGARPTGSAIPQADVTNLVNDLAAKAATTYVDTQVATRTTPAAVTSQINSQSVSKFAVDYVATGAVSLSGSQSVDGVLVGAGKRVLLPLQPASTQNGVWITATGAWTRATDTPTGSTFSPGTLVMAKSGATNANSIWQLTTTTSGVVDTNAQNWSKVLQGGPPVVYTGGNGVDISAGNVISAKLGAGLLYVNGLITLDPSSVIRKYEADVPGGSATVTITHGLGTTGICFALWEVGSNNFVAIAPTILDANSFSLEFGTAPTNGQYHIVVMG